MSTLQPLLDAIAAAPVLPGARCRGRHHLFDEAQPGEPLEVVQQRYDQALALCGRCPSLGRCSDWVDSLKPSQRPTGVVAGRIITERKPRRASA